MIRSAAPWSSEMQAFSAMIYSSGQEYETSSRTTGEGGRCQNLEGGCQNSIARSVEYSRAGSKTDGAEPPVAAVSCGMGRGQCTSLGTLGPWCARRV